MQPMQCLMSRRRYRGPRIFLGAIWLNALFIVPLLACALDQIDPLKQLDDEIIGAVIANRCRPSFEWHKHVGADTKGRKAYEMILSELRAKNPNDSENEENADRTFKLRTEQMFLKGNQIVSEKGCEDLEIQNRLRKFESGD